ncbi:hypothetical protein [Pinibacter aurantiacus]|uniref:Uncharacterized protein n=1 Tax=Pinibacter aurantiacus TaxID=2851599 RepID=A0A9E2S3H1_9BACT|nr:hypothetical protein [Pinibacter aurantiacus]MBV4355913.1 hypothetical protein [Pinibacter aurantiacus]
MSDTFNLKRFGLLLKKTITERPTQTIGVTALLLILSLTLYIVAKNIIGFNAAQNLTFVWGLAGGGFFLASFVFNYFNSNASGSSYLTLPASYFEKWLCGVLIAGVFYPVIFLLFYHLMDVLFVAAYHSSLDPNSLFYRQQYDSVFTFDLDGILAWKVYFMFAMLTGFMLIGGLYFNKTALVKTAIAICIFLAILLGLNWFTGIMFFGPIKEAGIYDHVTLEVGKAEGVILLPAGIEHFFRTGIAYFLPAVLWLSPLLRLREKEF